jgi:predicted transcriptional regulator of viral defense system
MPSIELRLADIGSEQWGLVTTAQARDAGATTQQIARMANAGDLVRLSHGVYRLAGNPVHRHEDLRVAWLGLEPTRLAGERLTDDVLDVVSHRSAAVIHQFGDLDADVMEFTVGRRRQTRRDDVRIHRGTVTRDEVLLVEGLPATDALRTVADLAVAGIDRGHLATIVRDAMLKHDVDAERLAAALAPYARRYGMGTGDGRGLVSVMLREAGVPRSAVEVAARADTAALAAAMSNESRRGIMPHLDPKVWRSVTPQFDPAELQRRGRLEQPRDDNEEDERG